MKRSPGIYVCCRMITYYIKMYTMLKSAFLPETENFRQGHKCFQRLCFYKKETLKGVCFCTVK